MKKIHRTFIGLLVLAAILTSCKEDGSVTAEGQNESTTEEIVRKTELVRVQKIQVTEINRDLNLYATLEPYEKISVAPTVQGHITKLYAEVGDKVSAGQMLVKMDETQYISTKLNYENTKIQYDRIAALSESDNIAKQTYDQTKSQFEILKTSLQNLEANTYVKAPFSGVIASRNYEDGDLYTGMPIYQLIQTNILKGLVSVPESYIQSIKAGMKIELVSEALGDTKFAGVVDFVYPTVDPSTHTFQMQVKVPNAKETLRPGMYVHTTITVGKAKVLLVPYQSVLKLQGANDRYVFINNEGKAKYVAVKLGERFNDQIEIITDEIKDGDELVVVGQAKLSDGTPLTIVTE